MQRNWLFCFLTYLSFASFSPLYAAKLQKNVWNEFKPGGETRCAHGDPYAFFYYFINKDLAHCIYQGDKYYKRDLNDFKFRRWLSDYIDFGLINSMEP